MSGIFHRNIVLMLVSIAVIPIMASLNAPSLSTKIGSIRPRPNSPRMEAVVEAEVDAAAEVALLVEAVAMVVIKPTPAESGRAMMLRCLQSLPLMVALENIMENGAWFANLAGGITHTTGYHNKWVADPKSFSLPATHLLWSKSGKNPPEGGGGWSTTPTAAITTTAASVTSGSSLSSRVGPLIAQYKTNTEDGQFASFLADFERVLN
jgi:hypothetical protein